MEALRNESLGRLLLRHAVQCAESPDKVSAVDTYDFAIWKELRENAQGFAVVWIVKGWDEDEAVGDVEVAVARGQALTFENNWRGHGEFDDAEGLAVQVTGGFEAVEVFGERQVVVVACVWFDYGDDRVF